LNFIEDIKQQFREAIDGTLEVLRNNQELTFEAIPEYAIEVPRERNHGDFAANVSMLMAKEARMAPRKIAELIVTHLSLDESLVRKVEVAGAGFINFYLNQDWLYKVPPVILAMKDDYGKVTKKNGTRVQVEFVSANPTGDLHMGNARRCSSYPGANTSSARKIRPEYSMP
jgi:arginyl-tRNA synthetase